ncbi:hypothetical protein BDZ91DRAFT_709391 [Kalaharituber pfeilii]|nr:hypothetical protein BDZ91DRAFT_709391 [Kalaharituber pfeilii]
MKGHKSYQCQYAPLSQEEQRQLRAKLLPQQNPSTSIPTRSANQPRSGSLNPIPLRPMNLNYGFQPLQEATAAMIEITPEDFEVVDIDEEMVFDGGVQMVETVTDSETIEALMATLTADEKVELIAMVDKGVECRRVWASVDERTRRGDISKKAVTSVDEHQADVEASIDERQTDVEASVEERQADVEAGINERQAGAVEVEASVEERQANVEVSVEEHQADVEASIDERQVCDEKEEGIPDGTQPEEREEEWKVCAVEASIDECQADVEVSVDERQVCDEKEEGILADTQPEEREEGWKVCAVEAGVDECQPAAVEASEGEEEEKMFGYRLSEFPTERRPIDYEKNWDKETSQQQVDDWFKKYGIEIGKEVLSGDKQTVVKRLLYTWWSLLVVKEQDLPLTDPVMHEIQTYRHAKPHRAKSQISAEDEIEWQLTNILKMSGTIIRMDPRGEESLLKTLHKHNKQQGFSGNQRDEEQEELGRMIFEYFFDDYGGTETVWGMVVLLHSIHFPRMSWASLLLKPKTEVAVSRISPLGRHVGLSPRVGSYRGVVNGLMASKGKIGLIPGRAEHARIINRSPLTSSKGSLRIVSMVANWSRSGRNHTDWHEWWEMGRQVIRKYCKPDKSREGMPSMRYRCSFLEKREDC